MRIALLAPSGAGKTSYLTGLYGILVNDLSYSRYGIDFAVPNTVLRSSLDQRYTQLVEQQDFGDGSKEMTTYPFSLSARDVGGNIRKLSVEIVDFPGGFLHRASETKVEEVERVIDDLSACDGFIVLLDGDALISGVEKRDPRILQNAIKASAIQDVLVKMLERRRANIAGQTTPLKTAKTPIAFALTKGDRVDNWLARDPDTQLTKLKTGISRLFALRADAAFVYDEREGAVSNFIRSQFSRIIEDPNVCSLRTAVTVYNETEQMFDPRSIETLFQYVLFTGLLNATKTYDVSGTQVVSELSRNIFRTLFNTGTGKVAPSKDEEKRDTLQLFLERVLPDELVYRLCRTRGSESFYQQGLEFSTLASQAWWKKKNDEGRKIWGLRQS